MIVCAAPEGSGGDDPAVPGGKLLSIGTRSLPPSVVVPPPLTIWVPAGRATATELVALFAIPAPLVTTCVGPNSLDRLLGHLGACHRAIRQLAVVTASSASFAAVTALSASLAVVTALSASLAVATALSATVCANRTSSVGARWVMALFALFVAIFRIFDFFTA